MSYILFVNPQMLSQTGMPVQGVFLATIIGSVVGTLMMAFYANLPYAQAPGMGLNAFFTFTVVFGMGYILERSAWYGLHLWNYFTDYYLDKCS